MVCISHSAVALLLVLLADRPDATVARLSSAPRKLESLLPEFDLPVFHLLHDGKVQTRTGAWALKGTPTHYTPNGCKKINKVYGKVNNELGAASMSVGRCFAFCAKRKGLSYFGISNGNACWCGKAIDAAELGKAACDSPCPGNPSEMCGGIQGSSVYTMFDCTNATKEEIAEEKAEEKQALLTSYGSFSGETCGQDKNNILQLDGKGFISGSIDTCKIACWKAKGAEECHGFTYDALMSKCTFHYDVTAGPVSKNEKASCHFKMP